MGTCSPSAWLDDATREDLRATVVVPTVRGLAAEGRPFRGVLFIGVMLTEAGPKVLEYNARFGDPETQVLIPRSTAIGWRCSMRARAASLRTMQPRWRDEASCLRRHELSGYPGAYTKGVPIEGSKTPKSWTA
jgi:phosphoribosylamine--glycine ligase